MLVETADAGAVAMRIPRAEWAALREADIRTAVDSALETHGLAPCRRKGGAAHRQTHF